MSLDVTGRLKEWLSVPTRLLQGHGGARCLLERVSVWTPLLLLAMISKCTKNVTCSGYVKAILLHKFIRICLYLHMAVFVAVAKGMACTARVKGWRLWVRHEGC